MTHLLLYRSVEMPFRLELATGTFQSLMNVILSPLNSQFAFLYFDDIVLFSRSQRDHPNNVKQFFHAYEIQGLT